MAQQINGAAEHIGAIEARTVFVATWLTPLGRLGVDDEGERYGAPQDADALEGWIADPTLNPDAC
jgi:hypothetical protein